MRSARPSTPGLVPSVAPGIPVRWMADRLGRLPDDGQDKGGKVYNKWDATSREDFRRWVCVDEDASSTNGTSISRVVSLSSK